MSQTITKISRAITKKDAIRRLHIASDLKIKIIDWIKLPENGRILIYEIRSQDYILRGRDRIETRYQVYPAEGGGSGGTLSYRSERKRKKVVK